MILRFFAIFLLGVFFQNASAFDFSKCRDFYKNASVKIGTLNGAPAYAVALKSVESSSKTNASKKNVRLFAQFDFMPKLDPGVKILRFDPLLGLYEFSTPTIVAPPKTAYDLLALDKRTLSGENLAIIDSKSASPGKILSRQNGLKNYARFSAKGTPSGVVSNICYHAYGVTTANGFLEKRYIDKFFNAHLVRLKDSVFSDIYDENKVLNIAAHADLGIRVDGSAKVIRVDVFIKDNPFKLNDKILSINGAKTTNGAGVEFVLAGLKIGKKIKIEIERSGKILAFEVESSERSGGWLIAENMLDKFGIVLKADSKNQMSIEKAINYTDEKFSKLPLPLKIGDKILKVNGENVGRSNFDLLLAKNPNYSILVLRNGFEFFIKNEEKWELK